MRAPGYLGDPHLDLDIARQAVCASSHRASHPGAPVAARLPDLRLAEVAFELEALLLQELVDREPQTRGIARHEAARLDDSSPEEAIRHGALFVGDQRAGARLGERLVQRICDIPSSSATRSRS